MKISIEIVVQVTLSDAWEAWTSPSDITQWNFATDEWCCPNAVIELKEGCEFNYRMEARDGSMGFDFKGTFTKIVPKELIQFELEDQRVVTVQFAEQSDGIQITETFDAEDENSAELQRQGWQSILENFKKYIEQKSK